MKISLKTVSEYIKEHKQTGHPQEPASLEDASKQ